MGEHVTNLLKAQGAQGVQDFRKSLKDNDRDATGATSKSLTSFVTEKAKTTTLIIRAVGHPSIQKLETGQTAGQIRQDPPIFEQIVTWTRARGLGDSAVAGRIYANLFDEGWNQDLPNRTGKAGGTEGVLSNPREQILKNLAEKLPAALAKDLKASIKL